MSSVKEVAQRANVSVATVSRVLNQDPAVKPETRRKVQQVIEELNYQPNLTAKNLRNKKSKTIVMVLQSMANPFYAGITRGAQAAIHNSGYNIIIGTTEFGKDQVDTYIHLLKSNLADGIIFVSTVANKEMLRGIIGQYPIILVNEYYDDLDLVCVSIDNKKAGYDATRELIRRGHKNIVYLAGYRKSSSVLGRISGYKQALAEAGIPYNPDLIARLRSDYDEVKAAIQDIIGKGIAVDGILAHSDVQAAYVLKAIKEKQIPLPPSISIISFDGTFLAEITNPGLSTISQPMYDLGYHAVQILLQKLQHKGRQSANNGARVILPHQLIIRET